MADNEDPKINVAPGTTSKPVEAKIAPKPELTAGAKPALPPRADLPPVGVPVVPPKVPEPAKAAPVKPSAIAPVTIPEVAAPAKTAKPKAVPAAKAPTIKPPVAKAPAAKTAPVKEKPVANVSTVAAAAKVNPAKAAPVKSAVKVAKDVSEAVATVSVPKAAAPNATPKIAPAPASQPDAGKPVFAGLFSNFMLEETTMNASANFSGFQDAVSQAQAQAKAAFDKGTSVLGEVSDFAKGNVEAAVESGKIYAEGVQALGSELVAESRTAFETMTGDFKELAAAKSPTDFFKLQSDLVRKNFDTAVAYSSKNSEAMLKLFSDTFAPISGRVSLAVEKARSASVSSPASPL